MAIFDKQGSIAGLQYRLPWSVVLNTGNKLNLDELPMYQNGTDVNYMILTAYFKNPDNICKVGPTEYKLEDMGTGDGLWFQNGASPAYTIGAPKLRSSAIQEGWTNNSCYPGMGVHNGYRVDTWDSKNCTEIIPFTLLYNLSNELQGFIFFTPGNAVNKYLESIPYEVFKLVIAPNTPVCSKNLMDNGVNSLHVYFVDKPWEFKC